MTRTRRTTRAARTSDPALYDERQDNIAKYQGGDLRGMENALQPGYFNDLGVTALWLTPTDAADRKFIDFGRMSVIWD